MRRPLTSKQARTLVAIIDHLEENGYPPSTKELSEALGIGYTTAHQRLHTLERNGWVTTGGQGTNRQLRITDSEVHVHLPLDMQDMIRQAL